MRFTLKNLKVAIFAGYLASTCLSAEVDTGLMQTCDKILFSTNLSEASQASASLRWSLTTQPAELTEPIRAKLEQSLALTQDGRQIQLAAIGLSGAPAESAIITLAGRLATGAKPELEEAICKGLTQLTSSQPNLSASAAVFALGRLEAVMTAPKLDRSLLATAMLSTAAFRSAGFDQLVRLKQNSRAPIAMRDAYYTALSETQDVRALTILLEAAMNDSLQEGNRIQAVHAVGTMCCSLADRIPAAERDTCRSAMARLLARSTSDQLFGVALKALASAAGVNGDSSLREWTLSALRSRSTIRREAALDVLYQQNDRLSTIERSIVEQLAQIDNDESVRATASAILDKEKALSED